MVSLVSGSYEPVCHMPPPPVFQALVLSFQVSLPGSPGLGTEYQRHNSLPVLASSAASQPRVPPPAPLATSTLPSAVTGAELKRSLAPNSFTPTSCRPPSASAQASRSVLTCSRLICVSLE